MPSTYTVNLGIEKPATGEQSGTWGDTTNVNFDIIDQAVNGSERVTLTSAGTSGSPNDLNIVNGSTTSSEGRNKWIEIYSASDLGGSAYVRLVPNDAEKILFIRNSLAGSQSVLLFQGTYNASNDLEIPAGVDMVVRFDGAGASATVTDVFTKLRATEITTPTLTAGTADINGGSVDGATVGAASASTGAFTTLTASTSLNIASSTTVDGVLDEDDMSSDSATKLATQQSIKAYVDSQVGTVDTLAEILANGNTSGSNNLIIDNGQALTSNTINETTAGSGVTIDSVLLKDDVVNATDIETSSISANDGTAAATIANSTGNFTITNFISNSVDIGGGAIDGTVIGGTTTAAGSFTTGQFDTSLNVDGTAVTNGIVSDGVALIRVSGAGSTTEALTIYNTDGASNNSQVQLYFGANDYDTTGRGLRIDAGRDSGADGIATFYAVDQAEHSDYEAIKILTDGGVTLSHLGSNTLATTSTGIDVTGAITTSGNLTVNGADVTVTANIIHAGDTDTYYGFHGNNLWRVVTGGFERIEVSDSGFIANDGGYAGADFRVESDSNTHMLFVDAGNDYVGINNSAPAAPLHILGATKIGVWNSADFPLDISTGLGSQADPAFGYLRFTGYQEDVKSQIAGWDTTTNASNTGKLSFQTKGTDGLVERFGIVSYSSTYEIIANDTGQDQDFRVESNGNTHALFVEGDGTGVGINTSNPEEALHVTGTVRLDANNNGVTTGDAVNQIIFRDNDTATGGGQPMGDIDFVTQDSGNEGVSGRIRVAAESASTGDGRMTFSTGRVGTLANNLTMTSTEAAFNQAGADIDFRIESDSNSNMIFVDASIDSVGIGTGSPSSTYALDIAGAVRSSGSAPGYTLLESDASNQQWIVGSYGGTLALRDVTGTTYPFQITTGAPTNSILIQSGGVTINDNSADQDFRVESDTNTHALFVDAGNNHVNINTSVDAGGTLNVAGDIFNELGTDKYFRRATYIDPRGVCDGVYGGYLLLVPYNTGGPNAGAFMEGTFVASRGNSGTGNSPARCQVWCSANYTNTLAWYKREGAGQFFQSLVRVTYSGTEYVALKFSQTSGGPVNGIYFDGWSLRADSNFLFMARDTEITGSETAWDQPDPYHYVETDGNQQFNYGVTFNEGGGDHDFRVESDGNANAIFVDASTNEVQFFKNDGSLTTGGAFVQSTGRLLVATNNNIEPLILNRQDNDGILAELRQANSVEGTISVSGSTVSYNGFAGRHESSGVASSTAKGTVVSTIDELDTYLSGPKQGQTRADHAKVKVSDVVGDACVYGVVDDFTAEGKVNIVAVGIGAVRVTGACSKGDLLESNGDGTAKVQSDDIVRSKTIGKVTIGDSDTGVKLVSCVLYCG
jgi:hypothetical protein